MHVLVFTLNIIQIVSRNWFVDASVKKKWNDVACIGDSDAKNFCIFIFQSIGLGRFEIKTCNNSQWVIPEMPRHCFQH